MLLVLVASVIGSLGAAGLKSGATRLQLNWRSVVFNHHLGLGIGLFLLSSYFYILGMREGELSILYPMVALGYVFTLFWSRLFFAEPFTRNKFIGLGMILFGMVLLYFGNR
jgi:undecaprenyl phosphate-alpha-L-ara4N flippase subunit ArnE